MSYMLQHACFNTHEKRDSERRREKHGHSVDAAFFNAATFFSCRDAYYYRAVVILYYTILSILVL